MDIGGSQIVTTIASSTTNYLELYSPIFLLIAGLILAFVVIEYLISLFKNPDYTDMDGNVVVRNGFTSGEEFARKRDFYNLNQRDIEYYNGPYYPGSKRYKGKTLDDYE